MVLLPHLLPDPPHLTIHQNPHPFFLILENKQNNKPHKKTKTNKSE